MTGRVGASSRDDLNRPTMRSRSSATITAFAPHPLRGIGPKKVAGSVIVAKAADPAHAVLRREGMNIPLLSRGGEANSLANPKAVSAGLPRSRDFSATQKIDRHRAHGEECHPLTHATR